VLIELGVVEQRHKAVLEVMGGLPVTEVAASCGVTRQTVHRWLRWYAQGGIAALADGSRRPTTCPHRMAPELEARIVALRTEHPGWGPRTLLHYLERDGVEHLPGRSSVHRCLIRHGLIEPHKRRRKRADYRRWERLRSMELWQMDVMGGVRLAGGHELKIITGIDDHSRFCVCAHLTPRATARPLCEAFLAAMRRHGAPEQVLTDNGKVFTARFGRGKGLVLFDRICHENGIRHLLTAPRSPTTTGKVERFHKTLRSEFLKGRVFASLEEAQEALDEWVEHYNSERPHQGIGMTPPLRRFELAAKAPEPVAPFEGASEDEPPELRPLTRLVAPNGTISFETARYLAGAWLAGEAVELTLRDGLLEIAHRGVLVACHAHRRAPRAKTPARNAPPRPRPRPAPPLAAGPAVTRKVDPTGYVSFAGRGYFVSNRLRGQQVEVRLSGGAVQISQAGVLLKTHVARHDRTKEHGAFSTPQGRPHRTNASRFSREESGTDQPEPRWNAGGGT
jgi:transposase InsO family protein